MSEPLLHLTEGQLRLVVFQTSRAYARARMQHQTEQACEWERNSALTLTLLEIAEGTSGH